MLGDGSNGRARTSSRTGGGRCCASWRFGRDTEVFRGEESSIPESKNSQGAEFFRRLWVPAYSVYLRVMRDTPPYIELHCHSGYSFRDGASHPEELVLRAKGLGYPALALTDHDGLYGSMEFAQAARSEGIQPITGAEVTVKECGLPGEAGNTNSPLPALRPGETGLRFHLTLLVETPRGYANLCRLLTETHMKAPREDPALPLSSLLSRTEGIILLTGCRRSPLLHALEDAWATGEAFVRRLREAFGPHNLFIELQENGVRGDGARNRVLGRLGDQMNLPVVATGNVHYHRRRGHRLQDVLTAIRYRTTLDASHGLRRPNSEFYLAPPRVMARRFRGREDALESTLEIAERCAEFDLTRDLGYTFPDFEGSQSGEAAIQVLGRHCRVALEERYPEDPSEAFPDEIPSSTLRRRARHRRTDAEERLEEELVLVERHGLAGFFLVYRDIMDLARKVAVQVRGSAPRAHSNLPPGRGRGSSVSSLICYLIGLSHVDPVEANLFLGRFLNDALESVPDIDLDFPRDIREELILAVYEKYGSEHTGLVATFPTYRLRSAVREVGRVLDLPIGELEKLAKLSEGRSGRNFQEEMVGIPGFEKKAESPLWALFSGLVEEVAGLPRHLSQHVGGMIISSRPLVELVPLEPAAMEGRILCQWDKDSCDDAGFIKIDFLALGMLSLVEEATDLIAERGTAEGAPVPTVNGAPDLSRIDLHDEAIYDRICAGDTVGVFQVESRAQIQMLRRVRPRNLAQLAIQVAIVRPGPIVGGAVNPYVRRREEERATPGYRPPVDHPLLQDPLQETLGVIIFQDQVLQVCRALAGFTDGQAEGLRRAMSRKRSKEAMRSYRDAFLEGARQRGVEEDKAEKVFRQVVAFSEFGFPKSHAAAFALLAYQSAWLRHYFPTEYTVALFNNQPMGFYSLDALARDARRNGVRTFLPDVNRSGVHCTAEGGDLRVGLGFVRGWGERVAQQVVEERESHGSYRSLVDFLRRTPAALKRPAVENLIWVGGMDGLGLTRRELLWQTGLWLGPEEERERRAAGRQDDPQLHLGLSEPYSSLSFSNPGAEERLVAEYRLLHFSTELHPLSLVRNRLPKSTVTSGELPHRPQGATVELAGVVVARQRPQTAKGHVFVLMEDEEGPVNVIVKPKVYEQYRTEVRMEPFLVVQGRLQKDGATLNVIAHRIRALRGKLAPHLPDPLEYFPERGAEEGPGQAEQAHASSAAMGTDPAGTDPFRYLSFLRESPPEARNFG